MYSHSLAMSAVALVVFVGAARAEINEAPLAPAQPLDTVMQPAPQPPSAPVISRRIQPRRRPESISLAHPYCADWFACGQYRMVGIGF
jgi:hypothetical protein